MSELSNASLYCLPAEVLTHVAGLLSIRDRFVCGLVCSRLHQAATAATNQIQVVLDDQAHINSFSAYLHHHGCKCTSLDLNASGQLVQLQPCKQVQQLRLTSCQLNQGADGSTWPGLLQCTGLTRLEMFCCSSYGDRSSALMQLKALTGLQHLCISSLKVMWHSLNSANVLPWYADFPLSLLAHFPHLSYLQIGSDIQVTGSLQHVFAAASQLHTLDIEGALGISEEAFAGLDQLQHFKCLRLSQPTFNDVIIDQHTAPSFGRLTALQEVALSSCSLHPDVLLGSPQLQFLDLLVVDIYSDVHAGWDAAALLAVLPNLQELQSLRLCDLACSWPAAAPAYTALVASSSLTHLDISDCRMPAGVWQYVFAPGQHLPQLQVLSIWLDEEDAGDCPGLLLNTADLQGIFSCCPGLQTLSAMLQPATDHSSFTQLPALRTLSLAGTTAAGICTLATLTTLININLFSTANAVVQYNWLLPVTSMRQLTRLRCTPYTSGSEDDDSDDVSGCEGAELYLQNWKTPEDPNPDVWVKLVGVLADGHTPASIASSLALELAQAQQQIGVMQQQLASQQQAAAQHEKTMAKLKQQLAEQRASSATQAAQIAELQQQVQQLVQAVAVDKK